MLGRLEKVSTVCKRRYGTRILNKDGGLHNIDESRNYTSVSVLMASVTHYWVSVIENELDRKLTTKEYVSLYKKVEKVINIQLQDDYKKSIDSYPAPILNQISIANNKQLKDIVLKKLKRNVDISTAFTNYKLSAGNVVLRNNFEDNFDEYYVFTDRKYNAKSYRVNVGVKNKNVNEIKFCNE